MKKKYIIIVPTHSSYIDICENFISVLHKNWSPENYICILSICGPHTVKKFLVDGYLCIMAKKQHCRNVYIKLHKRIHLITILSFWGMHSLIIQ